MVKTKMKAAAQNRYTAQLCLPWFSGHTFARYALGLDLAAFSFRIPRLTLYAAICYPISVQHCKTEFGGFSRKWSWLRARISFSLIAKYLLPVVIPRFVHLGQ